MTYLQIEHAGRLALLERRVLGSLLEEAVELFEVITVSVSGSGSVSVLVFLFFFPCVPLLHCLSCSLHELLSLSFCLFWLLACLLLLCFFLC